MEDRRKVQGAGAASDGDIRRYGLRNPKTLPESQPLLSCLVQCHPFSPGGICDSLQQKNTAKARGATALVRFHYKAKMTGCLSQEEASLHESIHSGWGTRLTPTI